MGTNLETFTFSNLPSIGTTPAGQQLFLGGFSSLFFAGTAANGDLRFVTNTDRGPNGEPPEGTSNRPFLLPSFRPEIVRFTLNPNSGALTITDRITLSQADGTPITGLPNLDVPNGGGNTPFNDEDPINLNLAPITPLDRFGADLEGLVIDPRDNTFWLVDEYRPAIYHFNPQGVLIDRFVPTGTAAAAGEAPGALGDEVLPAILGQRRQNRGFEAVALNTDNNRLYAFVQSPLRNPASLSNTVLNGLQNIRVVEFDLATQTVTAQYLYALDNTNLGPAPNTRPDRLGDAVYIGNGQFLLAERDDDAIDTDPLNTIEKTVYRFSLAGATNVNELNAPINLGGGVSRTIDQMTPAELASQGINLIAKSLFVNLAEAGYNGVEKVEGLAYLGNNQIAVLNDNDFQVANITLNGNGTFVPDPNPEPIILGLLTVEPETLPLRQPAVSGITFLGQATFPSRSVTIEGTTLGGLSGITFDAATNRYYAISDDRGTPPNEPGQPPRFYTLTLNFNDLNFTNSDVTFTDQTPLLRQDGTPFPALSTDTESIRLTNRNTLFITSEGQVDGAGQIRTNPFVNEFNLSNGQLVRSLPVPQLFLPNANTAANLTQGARDNLAFESAALTPDNEILLVATENALFQDGPSGSTANGSRSRIIRYDLRTGLPTGQFLYNTDPVAVPPSPATAFSTAGLVDFVAIDNAGQRLLALERSFSVGAPGTGTGNTVRLYEIDLGGATNIAATPSLNTLTPAALAAIVPAQKRLILDLRDLNLATGLDNIEGITFGPILPNGQRSLILVSDDNFTPGTTTFSQILAFSVDLTSGVSPTLAQPVITTLPGGGTQIVGSDENNLFTGSANNDRILGLGGNDTVVGGAGNDALSGNIGNDQLSGQDGNDSLFGGRNNDTISGDVGNDFLSGDLGSDSIAGGVGNDTLTGVSPTSIIFPGLEEIDTLTGGAGNDLFVLGDQFRTYYDEGTIDGGVADYALLTDFSLTDDNIQLIRNPNNTGGTYVVGNSPAGAAIGAAIFINNDGVAGLSTNDELLAVLPGFSAANAAAITARFTFV